MGFFSSPSETRNNPKPAGKDSKGGKDKEWQAAIKKKADRDVRSRLSYTRVDKSADGMTEVHTTYRPKR